jgi:hypothetical protein
VKQRLLTILLTVVFAAQAAGLTEALHLAAEHGQNDECHAPADGVTATAGTSFERDHGFGHAAHDPAHCAICQALATFTPLHIPQQLLAVRLEPQRFVRPAANHPYLISCCIGTLGARAPPPDHLRTSV